MNNQLTNIIKPSIYKLYPKNLKELQTIIKKCIINKTQLSISGANYSSGGQCFHPNTFQVDMINFNKIYDIDTLNHSIYKYLL